MSAATPQPGSNGSRRAPAWLTRPLRFVLSLARRAYGLALAALVLWLSWLAFAYLLRSLLLPPAPPRQIVEVPVRLGLQELSEPAGALAGAEAVPNVRSPLAHFHRLTGWPRPDRANDCTRSGCHAPMPHGKRKQVRAFLNMHATALHCGVCHLATDASPLPLVWYDPQSGRLAQAPALLRAYAWLTSVRVMQQRSFAADDQRYIVGLLRQAAAGIGGEPVLGELARHLAAVRADSSSFRTFLETTRSELPHHFRAEYDTKLALRDAGGLPILGFKGREPLVRAIVAQRQEGEEPDPRQLRELHAGLREPTLRCTECHRPENGLVDLAALGYPPVRVQRLRSASIFQMIEDIAGGQPFYLPAFLSPTTSQPATRP